MKRSAKSLQVLAKLSQHSEQGAARELGHSTRRIEDMQRQMKDLLAYREAYIDDFHNATQQGMTAAKLCDYQAFLCSLDAAIAQQRELVKQYLQQHAGHQKNWHEKRSHSHMMDKVVDTRLRAERRRKEQGEQREVDDRPHGSKLIGEIG